MLEEAAKRDHRKLGKEMDLFHMQEEHLGKFFGIQMAGKSTHSSRLHATPTRGRWIRRG